MPDYRSDEWEAVDQEAGWEITRRHMVDVQISTTGKAQVLGLRQEKGFAPVVLRSGSEFRFRSPVIGFDRIVVRSDKPFGVRFSGSPRQEGEYNSGEKPPVVTMPEASNLVLKMRQLAMEHHRATRQPVLEPEDGPSFWRYEVDDDQELLFEEEAHEAAQKKKAAAKKAAQERAQQQPKEGPSGAPHKAQEGPSEPQAAPPAASEAPKAAE